MRRGVSLVGSVMLLAGCATADPPSLAVPIASGTIPENAPLQWVVPFQNWRDMAGNCITGHICWSKLTPSQRRGLLALSESSTSVYRYDATGSLSFIPSKFAAEKGRYQVVQYVMYYLTEPCQASNPSAGIYRLGVGARVLADITTYKRNLSLSDFIPITVAASQDKVRGNITINGWGISSSNRVLAAYLGFGGQVENRESLTKAIESMAVARAVMADGDTEFVPFILTKQETKNGACAAAA